MKYETFAGIRLPKIGYGTWRIGGNSTARRAEDAHSLAALRSALELGYTHFDTAEMYAAGHAEELLGRGVRESGLSRQTLFITTKVSPEHLRYEQVLHSCEASLRRLGLEYIDLYLIHWPSPGMKLPDAFRALNQLVREGKVRHLGVSNFNLNLLKQAQSLSETPLLTNQVPYSLSDRSYAGNGVLAHCQQNHILLTAYSPLDKGHLHTNKTVQELAQKHAAAPYQIALAWLAAQTHVITIPMSFDRKHQMENLEAAEILLTPEEIRQLN